MCQATIEQLLEAIEERKVAHKKLGKMRSKKKRLTEQYIAQVIKATRGIPTDAMLVFVAGESERTENLHWKKSELEQKLRSWLDNCNPFPLKMRFCLRKDLGQYFLLSWHEHY